MDQILLFVNQYAVMGKFCPLNSVMMGHLTVLDAMIYVVDLLWAITVRMVHQLPLLNVSLAAVMEF